MHAARIWRSSRSAPIRSCADFRSLNARDAAVFAPSMSACAVSSLISELTAHADMLGANTAASLAFNDRKSAQDLMGALRLERHILAACIYDIHGNIFAEYRREGAGGNLKLPTWQGETTRFNGS